MSCTHDQDTETIPQRSPAPCEATSSKDVSTKFSISFLLVLSRSLVPCLGHCTRLLLIRARERVVGVGGPCCPYSYMPLKSIAMIFEMETNSTPLFIALILDHTRAWSVADLMSSNRHKRAILFYLFATFASFCLWSNDAKSFFYRPNSRVSITDHQLPHWRTSSHVLPHQRLRSF